MKRFLKSLLLVFLLVAVAAGTLFLFYGKSEAAQLEARKPLEQLIEEKTSSSDYVPYNQIAPFLLEATVCVEDARFYSHGPLDIIGLVRGAISQFIPGMEKSGGSSISQQVVKNLYQQFRGGLAWKAAEMRLAYKLEKLLSKDEILALYVNIINYGDTYTGIYKASWGYFGYSPAELTDPESALLAGIPQSPAFYQLSNHAANAKKKQAVVLDAMVRNGKLTQRQADLIYLETIYYYAHDQWNTITADLWLPDTGTRHAPVQSVLA